MLFIASNTLKPPQSSAANADLRYSVICTTNPPMPMMFLCTEKIQKAEIHSGSPRKKDPSNTAYHPSDFNTVTVLFSL